MKIIEDTTQYKDLNFKKDTILDLCNLCSVSYNTNKVLKKKYNNKEIIFDKCRKCPTLKETPSDCQYFTTYYNDSLLICFRGTESTTDILADLNITRSKFIIPNFNTKMYVHNGFLKQFKEVCQDLSHEIESYRKDTSIVNKNKKIVFTGHSLGGALATLGSCYFSILNADLSVNCIHMVVLELDVINLKTNLINTVIKVIDL